MFSKKAKKLFTGWQFNESGKECWCSVTQLCPTLHNPMDCSLTGSSVHGISHTRILEWVDISYTRGSSWPRDRTRNVSCIGRWILYYWAIWEAQRVLERKESESCSVVSDFLWPNGLYSPWNSLGQDTGLGSLSLLKGILPTQGLNPGLLHCRRIIYQLSHKGSPRILEWVAYPFSSRSSWPRNQTGFSCIADGILTNWATREEQSAGPGDRWSYHFQFSSLQLLSHVRFFAIPWTAACQASLSITSSQSLLKLVSIESVMPSNHLILCHPLLLLPSIFPSIRVFSSESVLHLRWPKYWSFRVSISPSNE